MSESPTWSEIAAGIDELEPRFLAAASDFYRRVDEEDLTLEMALRIDPEITEMQSRFRGLKAAVANATQEGSDDA